MHVLLLSILLSTWTSQSPCMDDARYRQFDFWLGSWEVFTGQGQRAGHNEIEMDEDGCVLIERWTGAQGSTGMSINYFDPSSETWKQQWVAAAGYLVELEGTLVDEHMVLEGSLISQSGSVQPMRGTWTPLDDGRVRQHFEVVDSTRTWVTWFDGYYVREDG